MGGLLALSPDLTNNLPAVGGVRQGSKTTGGCSSNRGAWIVKAEGIRRGPVTLVVTREGRGGGAYSWTFASQAAAMAVAKAFREDEQWVLVQGVYESAARALSAAKNRTLVLEEGPRPGVLRKCTPRNNEKTRSSA